MNKKLFNDSEGNDFFKRNYKKDMYDNDIIINNLMIIDKFTMSGLNVLECGCSTGGRLNKLSDIFPNNKYFGLDPSQEAIKFGNDNYNNINFINTTLDDMSCFQDDFFDIILVPFVFMYVDRNLLIKTIYEIDRILKNNGILIITDFYSNRQRKNKYKHVSNTYIYKQNYFDIFLSTKNYFQNKLISFDHITNNSDEDKYDNTCFYVELQKDLINLFN